MKTFYFVFSLCFVALINADSPVTDNPTSSTTTTTAASSTTPVNPPHPTPPVPSATEDKVSFQFLHDKNYQALGEFQGKLHFKGPLVQNPIDITLNNLTALNTNSSYKDSQIVLDFNVNGGTGQVLQFVLNKNNETYSLDSVSVTWLVENKVNATAYNGKLETQLFNVSADHSYLCLGDQSLNLVVSPNDTSSIVFDFTNFKLDAFRNSNSTDIRSPTECDLDMKKNDFVPLAVGISLIALVVIVLIAFLIGRKRSRRLAYESV